MRRGNVLWHHIGRGVRGFSLAIIAILLFSLMPGPALAYSVDADWSPPTTVYIPETGQTIDRLFLDLWRSGGSEATFGYPITPEIAEPDGRIIQYFQYARFEYWPEGDANGNRVVLGAIGQDIKPLVIPRRLGFRAATISSDSLEMSRAWLPLSQREAEAELEDEPSYRYVAESLHGVWGGFRAFWEATGEAAFLGNPLSEEYVLDGTNFQVFERGMLRWRAGEEIALVPVGQLLVDRYQLPTGPQAQGGIPTYNEDLFTPPNPVPAFNLAPPAPSSGRAIVVSLSQQALWAYEDGAVVRSTYVSTGTEKFRTPTGVFTIIRKVPIEDMQGVIGDESWFVPDVPNVLYFTNVGHALHGTYWHSNFGTPMSHGCINLPLDVAEWMYDWAPMGMVVQVVE